jgi:hypothetical protein
MTHLFPVHITCLYINYIITGLTFPLLAAAGPWKEWGCGIGGRKLPPLSPPAPSPFFCSFVAPTGAVDPAEGRETPPAGAGREERCSTQIDWSVVSATQYDVVTGNHANWSVKLRQSMWICYRSSCKLGANRIITPSRRQVTRISSVTGSARLSWFDDVIHTKY